MTISTKYYVQYWDGDMWGDYQYVEAYSIKEVEDWLEGLSPHHWMAHVRTRIIEQTKRVVG
jgi:hypothetical protein